MKLTWARVENFGFPVYRSQPLPVVCGLTPCTLQVWRVEAGHWTWSLERSGNELPADCGYSSRKEAKEAATAWHAKHGATFKSINRLCMGSMRRFLISTSTRTAI